MLVPTSKSKPMPPPPVTRRIPAQLSTASAASSWAGQEQEEPSCGLAQSPAVHNFLQQVPMNDSARQHFLGMDPVIQLYVSSHWSPRRGDEEADYSGLVLAFAKRAQHVIHRDSLAPGIDCESIKESLTQYPVWALLVELMDRQVISSAQMHDLESDWHTRMFGRRKGKRKKSRSRKRGRSRSRTRRRGRASRQAGSRKGSPSRHSRRRRSSSSKRHRSRSRTPRKKRHQSAPVGTVIHPMPQAARGQALSKQPLPQPPWSKIGIPRR